MTYDGISGAKLVSILAEITRERRRQDAKHGFVDLHDGTGSDAAQMFAGIAKTVCSEKASVGRATWADVLIEEVFEALAERNPKLLRNELIQVAAVCVKWIQLLDLRVERRH